MIRAFFLALGLYMALVGVQCLVLDRALFISKPDPKAATATDPNQPTLREWKPAEWMPFALLSGGAVVMIYTFTIPKRAAS